MTSTRRQLRVWLGAEPVGRLVLDAHSRCVFQLDATYLQHYTRPVLGQQFEDDPLRSHHARTRLPAWFANLLPEGALRELVARDAGVEPAREFRLLEHLGDDLPGAVRVERDDSPAALAGSIQDYPQRGDREDKH